MASGDSITPEMVEVLANALLDNIRSKTSSAVACFLQTLPEDAKNHLFPFTDENRNHLQSKDPSEMLEMYPYPYLQAACQQGSVDVILLLLNAGVDPSLRTEKEGTPLEAATKLRRPDIIQKLMDWDSTLVEDEDTVKDLLVVACTAGHQDLARFWLEKLTNLKGEAPCEKDFVADKDPLIAACKAGHHQLAAYFVERKVVVIDAETVLRTGQTLVPLLQHWCQKETDDDMDEQSEEQCEKCIHVAKWSDRQLHFFDQAWLTTADEDHFDTLVIINLSHNALRMIPEALLWGLPQLESLDLSHNKLAKLPVPSSLDRLRNVRLTSLKLSNNHLDYPVLEIFMSPLLENLDLSCNKISSLNHKRFPSTLVKPVEGEIVWDCCNMRVLNLSYNKIRRIPQDISSAKSLEKLNISNNEIDYLPAPWDCPLMTLKASDNCISEVDDMHGHWSRSLQTLDLSNNKLKEIPWTICQLTGLTILNLSSNHITSMPTADTWSIYSLKELYLAENRLLYVDSPSLGLSPHLVKRKSTSSFASMLNIKKPSHTSQIKSASPQGSVFYSPKSVSQSEESVIFPKVFRDCLTRLDLSDNQLQDVPPSICSLSCLQKLDLSGNTAITKLPDGLAWLKNLHSLNVSGLKIKEPATVVAVLEENGPYKTRRILEKLSERLLACTPYRGMKLMLVGPEKCGKTSVLSCLTNKEADDDLGINIGSWTLHNPVHVEQKFSLKKRFFTQKSTESDSSQTDIYFSTWDLKGGAMNSIIHQSFFTPRALYLLVWDLRDGSEGIESLRPWLLNIQSRAPEHSIIIVSTHLDKAKKKQSLESVQQEIASKYTRQDGFPEIAEIIGVTATEHSGEGIGMLRQAIYKKALDMKFKKKWGSGGYSYVPVIGRMVPRTFTILKEIIANESERCRRSVPPLPPILKEVELTSHIKKIPDNKIETGQDIEEVANFLSTCGSIVHFNDHLQGLTSLYFTDPLWLYNILHAVTNIKDSYVREGRVHKNKLKELFETSGFGEGHFEEYLQLLQRLEILLPLSRIEFLIPSRLPKEKPGQELSPVQSKHSALHVLERLYVLPYTPPGFWSRLVSRVYVSLKNLNEESNPRNKKVFPKDLKGGVKLKRTSRLNKSMRVGLKLTTTNIMYWQRGVSVQHHTGRIMLKPLNTAPLQHQQEVSLKPGICIRVECQDGVFKSMGFMVDQVENLIREWYPGLLEFDDYNGQPLVKRLIPCPVCKQRSTDNENPYSLTEDTNTLNLSHHHFTITELALAATVKGLEKLDCPRHPQESIPLAKLIPDLLLLDLPVRMLDKKAFDFDPYISRSLGSGGFGEVFKAKFRKQDVAVKMLVKRSLFKRSIDSGVHLSASNTDKGSGNTKSSQESPASKIDFPRFLSTWTTVEENVDVNSVFIMDGFSNLRSEVATMSKLKHPCIIQLIGISIHHLCFAMELAPLGDLVTYLRKEMDSQREDFLSRGKIYQSVLDRVLTYKIALQIAHGVAYLHSKRIIYSDLKTDNVLLYSVATDVPVNIKLSDYGISRAMDLQGARGMAGPVGFCAPEIMRGRTFTEKVDWFSYGMLLYHLMTGAWPYEHLKTAIEVRNAVDSGVKPQFKFRDYTFVPMFPNLEGLMMVCWRDNPLERLVGASITAALENPSFLCLNNVINVDDKEQITCVHCSSGETYETSDRLWLWTGDGSDRKCAKVYVRYLTVGDLFRKSIEGSYVNCMIQVGQWELLGTKDGRIQLFGPPAVGPQQSIHQQDFKMDAEVLCFCYQPSQDKAFQGHLFAGLADGRVAILNHNRQAETGDRKKPGPDWVKSKTLTFEKMRCSCLELVPNRKELWIACGNKLRLINTKVMLLEKVAIAVTQQPEQGIVGLAHHQDDLFCIIERSSRVLQYSMSNQRLVRVWQCGNAMLLQGDILESESGVDLAVVLEEQEASEESEDDDDQEADKQTNDSSSEDIDSDSEIHFKYSYFESTPLQQSSTLPASAKVGAAISSPCRSSKFGDISGPLEVSRPFSAGDNVRKSSLPFPQVRSVLVVKDTLWIGMSTGDTLVICVDPKNEHKYDFGQVLAILGLFPQFGRKNGSVRRLFRAGKEHVVAWQQLRSRTSTDNEDHHYQLLVWQAWGSQDVWEFERICRMLKELELTAQ